MAVVQAEVRAQLAEDLRDCIAAFVGFRSPDDLVVAEHAAIAEQHAFARAADIAVAAKRDLLRAKEIVGEY